MNVGFATDKLYALGQDALPTWASFSSSMKWACCDDSYPASLASKARTYGRKLRDQKMQTGVSCSALAAVATTSASAPPPSPSSLSEWPRPSAKRIRPLGQEHNTRPGVKHSPQEFLLSALPKPCGWIISDLPSASCQQRFCLLGGGGVSQVSKKNVLST